MLMSVEEYEAIRLIDYQGYTQAECSEYSVRRQDDGAVHLQQRRKKLASALVEGQAAPDRGGSYQSARGAAEHCPRHGCRRRRCPKGEEQ